MSPQEALRCALAAVWAGADRIDAEAVTDQLADLGFVVVERPEVAPHALRNRELPFASTAGLPKKAVS